MKKGRINKKRLFIIAGIILLCILLTVTALIFLWPKKDEPQASEQGVLHLPNYDENIFLNKAYMDFQRNMIYEIGGVEQLFSYETDLEEAEPECKFFLEYFHTVINGEYEKIKDFYVDGYFEIDPKFTMQMLYEPCVRFHSVSKDEVDETEVELYNFQVDYKIFKNNGTFRANVPSNTAIPQIYQLIKDENGNFKIFRILEIEVKE